MGRRDAESDGERIVDGAAPTGAASEISLRLKSSCQLKGGSQP
jgi:hypothetical protein